MKIKCLVACFVACLWLSLHARHHKKVAVIDDASMHDDATGEVSSLKAPLKAKHKMAADDETHFLQSAADKMIEVDKDAAAAMADQLRTEVSKLQAGLKEQTQSLKEQVLAQSKKLAEKTRSAIKRAEEEASLKMHQLSEEAYAQTLQVKLQTLEELNNIAQRVKEQAAEKEEAERRESMESYLDKAKKAWRTELLDEYNESLAYLEQLINSSEKPEQAASFKADFQKHRKWFADAMKEVESSSDSLYFQLFQKNMALKNIVDALKFIESELKRRFGYSDDNEDFKHLSVIALYNINTLTLQKQQLEKDALGATLLSDNESLLIVGMIVDQLNSGKKISDLEKAIKERSKLLTASDEKAKKFENLAAEAEKKRQELSAALEKKIAEQKAEALIMKTTLIPKLEAATKETLSLKTKISSLESALKDKEKIVMDKDKTIHQLQKPTVPANGNPLTSPASTNPSLSPLDTTATAHQPVKPITTPATIAAPTAQEKERIKRSALEQDLVRRKSIIPHH